MKAALIALSLCVLTAFTHADAAPKENVWAGFEFLIGDWIADGGGQPGEATGQFSFQFEAGGKVLVRRNNADYPASKGAPASHHKDLLIVYREQESAPLKAMYFDSEDHVIKYAVTADQKLNQVQFVSDGGTFPRFRLTYRKTSRNTVSGDFEISQSATAGFSRYLHWTAHRLKPQ